MWSLDDYRSMFLTVGLIGVIAFSLPSMLVLVRFPADETFSELYVLGPQHTAEAYPFDVDAGGEYFVYLGVGDHLGSAAYYEVVVKLRNSSEVLPNATSGVPSPLPVLYTYSVLLADGQIWEGPLNFSFANVIFDENVSSIGSMKINEAWVNVDKSAAWDSTNSGYFYQPIIELWIYDVASNSFTFHDRFVTFWLNMTLSF